MRRAPVDLAPRLAQLIVVLAGAALASSQISHIAGSGPGQPWSGILVGLAAAAILLLHCFVTTRSTVSPRILASAATAQSALCLASGFPLGVTAGLTSLPVASLLLARWWIPATATVAAVVGIDVAHHASGRDLLVLVMMSSLGGVLIYGLARLSSLVQAVHAARVTLAAAAVSAERLRVAEQVRDSISGSLVSIRALAGSGDAAAVLAVALQSAADARAASSELRSLSLAPEIASARTLLASAGISAEIHIGHAEPLGNAGTMLATVLREAVTEVVRRGRSRTCWISTSVYDERVVLRVGNDGVRTADESIGAFGALAERIRSADGHFDARLWPDGRFVVEASMIARRVERAAEAPTDPEYRTGIMLFLVSLGVFCVQTLAYVPLRLAPEAVAAIAVVCGVQIGYGLRGDWRSGRLGVWAALAALAVVAFVPLNLFGLNWIGVTGYLAGSLLMALPYAVSIPLVAGAAAVAGTISGEAAHRVGHGFDTAFNALVTGILIYGLLRLIRLVRELRAADQSLTRAAALRERLRIARDLHDLLGHNLAAIVLKAQLAKRLGERGSAPDLARAAAELDELGALVDRARAELGTVLGEVNPSGPVSFQRELDSAQAVLKAAGIETELDAVEVRLNAEASAALGAVLREGVTNVLRHSTAAHCRIALGLTGGDGDPPRLRLTVENDGVSGRVTPPGSGLGNLSVRLADFDGEVRGRAEDGWYELEARLSAGFAADPERSGTLDR